MLLITDSITCGGELKSDRCCDITGVNLFQLVTLVGMHLKDTSNTLFFVLCCIQYVWTGVHNTWVHTEVSQLTYERVGHDLEYKSRERLFVGRMSYSLVAIQVNTLDRRDVKRRRHELNDSIQELLNTLISVCGTTAYRDSLTLTGCFS